MDKNKKKKRNKKVSFPDSSRGIFIFFTDILLFILAMYSGDYIIWFVSVLMGILIAISFFTVFISYASLGCTQYLSKAVVTKGETTELILDCNNRSPLFLIYAVALYQTPSNYIEKMTGITAFTILRKQSFLLKVNINTEIKGVYDVGFLEMRITDYFGFFMFKPRIQMRNHQNGSNGSLKLIVTPYIQNIYALPFTYYHDSLEEQTSMLGNNEQSVISDLRTYQYGDPLNRVNWKATAKHQELFINNFEKGHSTNVGLYIGQLLEKERISQLITEDYACECAASIIYYYLVNSLSVFLICDGIKDVATGQNSSFLSSFLMFMSESPVVTSRDSLEQFKIKVNSSNKIDYFYVIAEDLNFKLLECLNELRDTGSSVTVFLIRGEELPLDEEVIKVIARAGINLYIIPQGSQIADIIRR